ncbi:MAG: FMN phosphatase YigB (HAD superfamily) [Verrucomicrobiales bacterium]|jgi:FMN phosphatase YigB (HAD superfamily)
MNRINTLVFDIGNVLSHFCFEGIAAEAVRYTNLPIPAIQKVLIQWSHPFCLGELEEADFAKHCLEDLRFTGTAEDLKRAYNSGFTPNKVMRAVIERYASHYALYYLSDTNAWHLEHLLTHDPLLPHFKGGTTSIEVGVLKPNTAIYERASKVHGFSPSQAVFIDDREANVASAEAVGFTGLRYEPDRHADFEQQLSALLK